jgi:hypothetical protein
MVDYIGLSALIIGILGAVGACVAAIHIKLKSDCCSCCKFECAETKGGTNTPPRSPDISPPKDLRKIEDIHIHSEV